MFYPLAEQACTQCNFIVFYKRKHCFMKTINPAAELHALTLFVNHFVAN